MSGQRSQLRQIEAELELSQPGLTAMFDMFEELTSGESPNGMEQLPGRRWRWRPEMLGLLMLIVVSVTLGVLVAVGPHIHNAKGTGGDSKGTATCQSRISGMRPPSC